MVYKKFQLHDQHLVHHLEKAMYRLQNAFHQHICNQATLQTASKKLNDSNKSSTQMIISTHP